MKLYIADVPIPEKLEDIRSLQTILESVDHFNAADICEKEQKLKSLLPHYFFLFLMTCLYNDLQSEEKLEALEFLKEQLCLLLKEQGAVRYSSDLLILASIFYAISPHTYKFACNTGKLMLPHPSTILRLCRKYNARPANKESEGFLQYITAF